MIWLYLRYSTWKYGICNEWMCHRSAEDNLKRAVWDFVVYFFCLKEVALRENQTSDGAFQSSSESESES